jgi:hypothetical protein
MGDNKALRAMTSNGRPNGNGQRNGKGFTPQVPTTPNDTFTTPAIFAGGTCGHPSCGKSFEAYRGYSRSRQVRGDDGAVHEERYCSQRCYLERGMQLHLPKFKK